jgi:phosphate starvation-inducible PhoH-like protein
VLRSEPVDTGDTALPRRITLEFADPDALRELAGELNQNLKVLNRAMGVRVGQRGAELHVGGQDRSVDLAADALVQLYQLVRTCYHLTGADVDQACRMLQSEPGARLVELYQDNIPLGSSKRAVHPRSPRQRAYLQAIRDNDLVFGVGPAGTGKTYLAMAMALSALYKSEVQRIVLCRPAVEAGEKLGFLPGDLVEKVNPYLRPLYDALNDLCGIERSEKMVAKGVIEVAPLAFMRGRTLSGAFVILDEAQNTTPEQMKMFLTRLGLGSKVVVTGDVTQIDLPYPAKSGLVHVLEVLAGVEGLARIDFSDADIVRHPLVSTIVRAYDRYEASHSRPGGDSREDRRGRPYRGGGPRSGDPGSGETGGG